MKNSDYWRKRFKIYEKAGFEEGREFVRNLQEQFLNAQNDITKDIERWYMRLAVNNDISLQQAKRLLKAGELKGFHWDVKKYIKAGKENAIDKRWLKELENASARFHISRLEAMEMQMQQHLEMLYNDYGKGADNFLRGTYENGFYHSVFELQKGSGAGYDLARIDERKIDAVLKKPWASDGKVFSSRIWSDKDKLLGTLNTELTQSLMRGDGTDKAIKNLVNKMGASRANAARLVMTERAAVDIKAQIDGFKEFGCKDYEIIATLDGKTSEICRDMDGEHFPMGDAKTGVTAPPFHPNCRSAIAPYFEDEFGVPGSRAAKDEKKLYYVPDDMRYDEWKKAFVDGGDKNGLKEYRKRGLKHYKRRDILDSMDITKEWTKTKGQKGSVIERLDYIVDGVKYVVDGKHVVLKPSGQEKHIADVLAEKYEKNVELIPQVVFPQGVQTPDYLIDGDRFDLKSPIGKGKNLIYGLIAKKRKQADNFVIDTSNSPLGLGEIKRQIEDLYKTPRVGFVQKIVLIKNSEIIKVYSRK